MRLRFAAVDGAPDRRRTVVVEHQIGVAARAVQPALDTILRCCDGRAHGSFSGLPVGVGRSAGYAALSLHALAQLIVGLADVLAENMAAGGFVLSEIARWAGCSAAFGLSRRRRIGGAGGRWRLAGDQGTC